MKDLVRYLLEGAKEGKIDKKMAAKAVAMLSTKGNRKEREEYAVIGMSGQFAMAENLSEYRTLLQSGKDCIVDFPKSRMEYAKDYLKFMGMDSDVKFFQGGYLRVIDMFDYEYFGISPAEAKLMDPNQRRFLQTAMSCLQDAGYGGTQLKGKNVGIFVGYDNSTVNEYRKVVGDVDPKSEAMAATGNIVPIIASRLSYIMDFHGPSAVIDTSCSSTALALYFACLAIESKECDSAIIGSSRICMIPAMLGVELGVESGNGRTKAFDDAADGTGIGEGVGAIYIKRLKDAIRDQDDIYCLIKAVTANCDGDSTGISAPNPKAQANLIYNSMKKANISAESISYIEAHGTGTAIGDPIEIEGIQKAFAASTDKKQFCAIGSVKTNIGHLDHASGIASVIKCALSLKHGELYPSLHYHVPNHLIPFTDSPVYVNTELREWKSEEKRRCAMNAFGISGTNINIIMEEAPAVKESECFDQACNLPLVISAKSQKSFQKYVNQMIDYLEDTEERFQDICYTMALNDECLRYQCVIVAKNSNEVLEQLITIKENGYQIENSDKVFTVASDANSRLVIGYDEELKKYVSAYLSKKPCEYPYAVNCRRVHLPVYPYDERRCLIEIPKVAYKTNGKPERKIAKEKKNYKVDGDFSKYDERLVQDMANIWCSILGTESVSNEDNFYEIGGDSIFAMKMVAEIKETFHINIGMNSIMKNPTFENVVFEITSLGGKADETITCSVHEGITEYEMTNAQKQLYIVQKVNPEATAYNMFQVVTAKGNFEVEKFVGCVNQLVELQESLRTTFHDENGRFYARIEDKLVIEPTYYSGTIEEHVSSFIRPFDLSSGPLLRIGLVKLGEQEYGVMFDIHHIICDGMSTAILIEQLCSLYMDQPVEKLELNYSDYAIGVNAYEKTPEYKEIENRLANKFSDVEPLGIHTDFERKSRRNLEGKKISINLAKELSEQIVAFTKKEKITSYQFFLGLFDILLYYYTGNKAPVIGVPVSGRNDVHLSRQIGLFINTVLMQTEVNEESSCLEFLQEIKKSAMESNQNQCVSFNRLVELTGNQNESSHNPLFDVMFSMQNYNTGRFEAEDVQIESKPIENNVSKLDITLNVSIRNDAYNLEAEYATELFEESTIQRMLWNYETLIIQALEAPAMQISEFVLSDKEKEYLAQYESNPYEYNSKETMKACLEQTVVEYRLEPAVCFGSQSISYEELNAHANQLATILTQHNLHRNERKVAVICRRSIEMMTAIVASVKAGVCYLPLDYKYPQDRLQYILEDSGVEFIIYYQVEEFWDKDKIESINLEQIQWENGIGNLEESFEPESPMYMIYTSGSSGLPKGVSVTQKNVRNFIHGMNQAVPFKSGQKMLSVTTIGFDIFVLESFLALADGMEVVLCSEDEINDMDELCLKIIEEKVDILQTTPSRIRAMSVSVYFEMAMNQLQYILIGGEPFPTSFLPLFKNFSVRVFNVYGPTETTVWSTVGELTNSEHVHVGKPIANTDCLIIDSKKKRVPIGCIGELAIGGDGLSNGYYKRDQLNEEKFVCLPKIDKTNHYFLTGDLAYWDNQGNLNIVGRNDRMVKLNGYRIELDEIQSVITSIEQVKECAVFVANGNYLAACCTLKSPIIEQEIRAVLQAKIPDYMIPNKIMIVEELAHTPNGKLDIKRMAAMVKDFTQVTTQKEVLPENEQQKELLEVWKGLLEIEQLGIDDNLFERGANSMKVIEFLSVIKHKGYDMVINDIFANPTVRKLQLYIVDKLSSQKIKDSDVLVSEIEKELSVKIKICSLQMEESNVLYFVEEFTEERKTKIRKFVSLNVEESLIMTHFFDLSCYEADMTESKLKELIEDQANGSLDEKTIVAQIQEKCMEFENSILNMQVEKEFRMAGIQYYFLESKRYSGTMIAFKKVLDLKIFNQALAVFLNEQGLFRSDLVRRNGVLYWRQRDEIQSVSVPYADLSKYQKAMQFEIVDRICKDIYFKEYDSIKELYSTGMSNAETSTFTGLLYRMILLQVTEKEYYLILPVNHAIFDAMCGEIVKRRILKIYEQIEREKEVEIGQNLSYSDFVEQIRRGPLHITQDRMVKLYEIPDYCQALDELEHRISSYKKETSTYIRMEITEKLEQNDDNAWSKAFEILRLFCKEYLNISKIPFMVYYYGRRYYGKEYFDAIGEFIDMIPMVVSVGESAGNVQKKTQRVIALCDEHNISFSTLATHQLKHPMTELEQIVDRINKKTSIVFNFQGKLEENDMGVFEQFLYERLMQKLNGEEAKNIHVMTRYSNDKIQLDINLPFEVEDDSLKDFFENMPIEISQYEQKIIDSEVKDDE